MDLRDDSFWFLWDCFQGNPSSANLAGVVRLTLIKVLVLGVDEGVGMVCGVQGWAAMKKRWVHELKRKRKWECGDEWWKAGGGKEAVGESIWLKKCGGVDRGGVNSVIVWICECMYVFYGGRAMCNGVAEMISESGCVWVKWAGKRYRW